MHLKITDIFYGQHNKMIKYQQYISDYPDIVKTLWTNLFQKQYFLIPENRNKTKCKPQTCFSASSA